MIDIEKFLSGYIGAALWSTSDTLPGTEESGGEFYNLDDRFDRVSDKCKAAMLEDCKDFIDANAASLEEFKTEAGPNCDDWRLGFLFWLNRHGHGSGYWDECPSSNERGHELGEQLSDAAKVYSSFELYGDFEADCVKSHHYG